MTEDNLCELWDRTIRHLAQSGATPGAQSRAWLRVTKLTALDGAVAMLEAPSEFAASALGDPLREPVTEALSQMLGRDVSLHITTATPDPPLKWSKPVERKGQLLSEILPRMHREMIAIRLGLGRLLAHLSLPPVTEDEVDAELAGQ